MRVCVYIEREREREREKGIPFDCNLLAFFPGKGSGLGFSLCVAGLWALSRRVVLTRGGGLNRRKNAVEMSLTSKTASKFVILRRRSEMLSLFTWVSPCFASLGIRYR